MSSIFQPPSAQICRAPSDKQRPRRSSGSVYGAVAKKGNPWRGLPPTVPPPATATSWLPQTGSVTRRDQPRRPLADRWAAHARPPLPFRRVSRRPPKGTGVGSSEAVAASSLNIFVAEEINEEALIAKKRRAAENKAALERQMEAINKLQRRTQQQKHLQEEVQAQMKKQHQLAKHHVMAAVTRRRGKLGPKVPSPPSPQLAKQLPPSPKLAKQPNTSDAPSAGRRSGLLQQVTSRVVHEVTAQGSLTQFRGKIRDFSDWRRRHSAEGTKVFVLVGWFPAVQAALESRGWKHNTDRESTFWDLKWATKAAECKHSQLTKAQRCNHFAKATALSTKVGLLWTMRNMINHCGVHSDIVFPRCFDLNSPHDTQDFLDDYRTSLARSLLQQLVSIGAQQLVNGAALDVVLAVCCKKVNPPDDLDQPQMPEPAVSKLEWEVLRHAMRVDQQDADCGVLLRLWTSQEMREHGTLVAGDQPKPLDGWLQPIVDEPDCPNEKWKLYRVQAKAVAEYETARMAMAAQLTAATVPMGSARVAQVDQLLESFANAEKDLQCSVNGRHDSKNLWIVKPAAKSRGRGIRTFRDIDQLLHYVELDKKGAGAQWCAQKYIENPLIVAKRKFDIRQWVVVTCWDPLTVYFYNDCYVRFSSADYSDDDAALSDSQVHLANISINKHFSEFRDCVATENGDEITECMWTMQQLKDYLKHVHGPADQFDSLCVPRMKEIANLSLQSAVGEVTGRKGSWELYGYDFMIDDEFNPWLIEVNASPACGDRADGYSTKVTAQFVPKALEDLVKVVVDVEEWQNSAASGRGPKPDTGGWELIFEGERIGAEKVALGVNLVCQGARVQRPAKKKNYDYLYVTANSGNQEEEVAAEDKSQTPVPPTAAR